MVQIWALLLNTWSIHPYPNPSVRPSGIAATGGQGGQSAPLDSEKFAKNQEEEGENQQKVGKRGKKLGKRGKIRKVLSVRPS